MRVPQLHNHPLLVKSQLNGFHSTRLPLCKVVFIILWCQVQANKSMDICPKDSALKLAQSFLLPQNMALFLPPTIFTTLGIRLQRRAASALWEDYGCFKCLFP